MSGHLLATSTADFALQVLLVWVVVRAAALALGIALTPQARPALRRPLPYLAAGIRNEEGDEAAVYLCVAAVGGWRAAWPRLTHLSG